MKRLYKSKDSKVAGVCGGIAEYLSVDPTMVRIVAVILMFSGGIGVVPYIIGAVLMPSAPDADNDDQRPNQYTNQN